MQLSSAHKQISATGMAVNTMVFQNDDCLGYNTGYRAAMDCIEETFQIDKNRTTYAGTDLLILGAGGVSRAIAWGQTTAL